MRVEKLMTKDLQACTPEDTLDDVAQRMWDGDCGCLPVCASDGSERVVGAVTDRDICMCAHFQGKPLKELRVQDAMAHEPITCRPEDSLDTAERTMREAQIRRLPVVDGNGSLVGIVSLADLACEAARERSRQRKEITEEEVGDTLAAICEPGARTAVPAP